MKNEVIKLVSAIKVQDLDGFETEAYTETEVMAEIKSVGRTEFYQAAHDGINVSIIAVINADDYSSITIKPSKVKYDGEYYRIVRQYKKFKARC